MMPSVREEYHIMCAPESRKTPVRFGFVLTRIHAYEQGGNVVKMEAPEALKQMELGMMCSFLSL